MNDLDKIKAQLNPAAVVAEYTHQEPKPNRNIRCPNQRHADTEPSCSVDYNTGLWKCFGCGAQGDLLDLIGYCLFPDYDCETRPHFKQLLDLLAGVQLKPMPEFERQQRAAAQQGTVELRLEKRQLLKWTDNLLSEPDILDWLSRRGVRGVVEAQLGYTASDPALEQWQHHKLTIPHFYRGILTAVKLRHDPRRRAPKGKKYISMRGSSYAMPYNADCLNFCQKTVFLIETELDALALMELLDTDAVVALPAGSFTDEIASMLLTAARVVAVMDNDEAGRQMGDAIKKRIGRARIMYPPPSFKDLGDWLCHVKVNPFWFLGGQVA